MATTAPRRSSRIVSRPSQGFSALGGSADAVEVACTHEPARLVQPWTGEPGTAGTVAVVGAGKMGLPLAAQYASHGWRVIAYDIDQGVVESINAGRNHVDEPGVDGMLAAAVGSGQLRATLDGQAAAAEADVVILIVPIKLDDAHGPDFGSMDAAVGSIAGGLHAGQTVIFETTLPVGATRGRYGPRLAAGGLELERDLFVAFSPERLYSGAVLANLSMYPKLVGGLGPASSARAAAFYESVLDAEIVAMSSAEAAEMAKLAETTYRDVNIALANEFAGFAAVAGLDIREVIAAANSQPYSHVHQPGLGVGGHCIPVYPRFLLAGAGSLPLVALARSINDGQVEVAIDAIRRELGGLTGEPVLVLGLTYRAGVKELAYSQGPELVRRLAALGADVHAYDPLLSDSEIRALGASPWAWGTPLGARAIVTQTNDPRWVELDLAWFAGLRLIVDGRNSLAEIALPAGVAYLGVGVPRRTGVNAASRT
jgi:UDP-N-acetyl-D-mannosaminuronic acid dehydrogenase